jgi:hypothetical protein
LLRAVTDHERALLEFVDRELAGRDRDSLAPVHRIFSGAA